METKALHSFSLSASADEPLYEQEGLKSLFPLAYAARCCRLERRLSGREYYQLRDSKEGWGADKEAKGVWGMTRTPVSDYEGLEPGYRLSGAKEEKLRVCCHAQYCPPGS